MSKLKRRYTLVLHPAIAGHGEWRIIEFKRVYCDEVALKRHMSRLDGHFVIAGWPDVRFPSGHDFYER